MLGMMTFCLIGTTSCKDEIDQFDDHGNSSIVSFQGSDKAYMGDSISFDFEVKSSSVKINQAINESADLWMGDLSEDI